MEISHVDFVISKSRFTLLIVAAGVPGRGPFKEFFQKLIILNPFEFVLVVKNLAEYLGLVL
mgnify:CR=1 FL=1